MAEKFIEAEKISIVGKDGVPRLTMFSEDNVPEALFHGKPFMENHRKNNRIAGMLFFNPDGTENGGFIYGNDVDENGVETAGMSLTLDQFEQDQVLQVSYMKNGEHQQYGIQFFDRPTDMTIKEQAELTEKALQIEDEIEQNRALDEIYKNHATRAYIGKRNNQMVVELADQNSQPRLKMYIAEDGTPHIDFLDEEGNVTYSLPPK